MLTGLAGIHDAIPVPCGASLLPFALVGAVGFAAKVTTTAADVTQAVPVGPVGSKLGGRFQTSLCEKSG